MPLRSVLLVASALMGCGRAPKEPHAACAVAYQQWRAEPRQAGREEEEREFIRSHPSPISRDEAIALAVSFLRAEGYTDGPATVRPHRDIMELGTTETVLAERRDSVDPQAVGARRRARYWEVAFRLTAHKRTEYANEGIHPDPDRGRAVGISIDGRKVFMQHQDVCLALFED